MNRVYLIDKPVGISSYAVVAEVKRQLKIKQVGHTGTLDPFASGLLLICCGEATKIVRFLEAKTKTYLAHLRLGIRTDTADNTGKVIEEKPIPTLENAEAVLKSFLGKSYQVPPMYSALKVKGKKLYELARAGKEVERKTREITIFSIELLKKRPEEIVFKLSCSAGTYIRSLGEDIAEKLGTVGHLTELRRLKIGEFNVEEASNLEDFKKTTGLSILEALKDLPIIELDPSLIVSAKNGRPLMLTNRGEYALIVQVEHKETTPIAIYQYKDGCYRCLRGFNL
ncbi:tRNA pseudouridine(55) synthase TruB [bacterium]|jgi:tRNA pseudouridine55 synthase|nr:tRNA pseudouridine(55) synthase TruB [bacterium]